MTDKPKTHRKRKTFLQAFNEELKDGRWGQLPEKTQSILLAFCSCVNMRMREGGNDEPEQEEKAQ